MTHYITKLYGSMTPKRPEYLLDASGNPMQFETIADAIAYLRSTLGIAGSDAYLRKTYGFPEVVSNRDKKHKRNV